MNKSKLLVFALIAAGIAAFFMFDLKQYFTLDYFQAQRAAIDVQVQDHPLRAALLFFAAYVAVTGLSLPGATIMTLIGGAVFGLLWGTLIISFASTIGATLAFLASRFLLRDWVQEKFGDKLRPVNDGIAREGGFYLFALRLVPAFPFFVINLVMGPGDTVGTELRENPGVDGIVSTRCSSRRPSSSSGTSGTATRVPPPESTSPAEG